MKSLAISGKFNSLNYGVLKSLVITGHTKSPGNQITERALLIFASVLGRVCSDALVDIVSAT